MKTGITNRGDMAMNELETTLTQKGQVTIPVKIRTRLGLKPRDKVRFELKGKVVKLKVAPSRIARYFGVVSIPPRPLDWRAERETFEEGVANDAEKKDR